MRNEASTAHPEPNPGFGGDVKPELDPLDADAGEEGCLLAGADGEDRATERCGVQDDAEDDSEREEERDRVWDVRVWDRNDADARQAGRKAANCVRRQDSLRDASIERQRPYCHRKRRETQARDEKAVYRTKECAEDNSHDHRRPDRPAVSEELGHENSAEAEH